MGPEGLEGPEGQEGQKEQASPQEGLEGAPSGGLALQLETIFRLRQQMDASRSQTTSDIQAL